MTYNQVLTAVSAAGLLALACVFVTSTPANAELIEEFGTGPAQFSDFVAQDQIVERRRRWRHKPR